MDASGTPMSSSPPSQPPSPCGSGQRPPRATRRSWKRAAARATVVTTAAAVLFSGFVSIPGVPAPEASAQETGPGASGFKPPNPAAIFTPLAEINRILTGGASPGPWTAGSSQGLPTDVPVVPSEQAKKPGLGTQAFYPLERRSLGDRMELLVNLANGNVVVRNKDLAFAGTGLNTAVNHVYNNQATNRGSFGQRWTMTTGRDVGLDVSDPGKVVLQGPTGYRQDYTRDGDGFTSPSGANAKLTKTDDGYELRFDKSKEKWRFDNNGFFTSQVDRNDNTINYRYNPNGTLASIADTRGAVTTFEYDLAGRVTKMTDPTGYEYGPYDYDLAGRHTGFRDPSGKRVAYGYDDAGNLTTITDPNGNEYRLRYDDQRRITAVDEPRETGVLQDDRAVTTYEYTSDSETRSTNPAGGTSTYTFDDEGRQTKAKDPLGREQSDTWTANSDVNTTTSVGGNVTTASFDPNNNLVGTQLPTGARNAIGYTDGANPNAPTSVTDSEGRQTSMTYDAAGNPLTVKNAATGQGIERTYNDNGTVKDSTDGRGSKTSYAYDDQGRLLTVTPPAGRQPVSYTYDSRSRITSVRDGNGKTIKYAYDAADRVVQLSEQTNSGDRVIQQSDFDANGNKIANYFAATTKQFSYSPRNQVLTDVRRGGGIVATDTVAYTYDANNNLASLRDGGGTTSYRYNPANDITELTDLAGGITRYTYDNDGNQTRIQYPNGQGALREFDKSQRLTKITNYARGGNEVRSYNYGGSRGDTDLVQSVGEPNGATTRYTYDGAGQLTRAATSNGATYSYAYDRSGNITNFQGTAMTYNAANQVTRVGGTNIGSDGQGNITAGIGGGAAYSPTNQQTLREDTTQQSFQVKYDTADTTQIQQVTSNRDSGTGQIYDVTQTALGITAKASFAGVRHSVSRDPSGTPVMQRNPDRSLHYFELDRQGSVTGHTRADGTRTASFRYQPFGSYERVSGADSGQADNFIGFQGGFFVNSPAHTQFGHRWYDSRLGRFTQPDPIGTPGASGDGQSNRNGIGGPYSVEYSVYSFAASNPCNFSDPSGLATCPGAAANSIVVAIAAVGTIIATGGVALPVFILVAVGAGATTTLTTYNSARICSGSEPLF
jgi:RHS repeat-associated protein